MITYEVRSLEQKVGISMIKETVSFPFDLLFKYQDFNHLNILNTEHADALQVKKVFLGEKPIKGTVFYYGEKEYREGRIVLREDGLIADGEKINCELFGKFSNRTFLSCFFYIFTCTDREESQEEIGQLTYHLIKNYGMDMAREWIRTNFISKTREEYPNEDVWCSPYFGPGYYGMELEEGKKLARILHAEELGITFHGSFMEPMRSSAGILFCFSKEPDVMLDACSYCKASKDNCVYCGGKR